MYFLLSPALSPGLAQSTDCCQSRPCQSQCLEEQAAICWVRLHFSYVSLSRLYQDKTEIHLSWKKYSPHFYFSEVETTEKIEADRRRLLKIYLTLGLQFKSHLNLGDRETDSLGNIDYKEFSWEVRPRHCKLMAGSRQETGSRQWSGLLKQIGLYISLLVTHQTSLME